MNGCSAERSARMNDGATLEHHGAVLGGQKAKVGLEVALILPHGKASVSCSLKLLPDSASTSSSFTQ
jgi:hypothetical protein